MQASLSPTATERSLLWLLPALALYLSALQFSRKQKRVAVLVLLLWIFIGALFGLAQKAAGLDSMLYFFSNTNRGSAVGLFANNNHYAIAMAASLPLVWAGLVWLFNRRAEKYVHPLWFPAVFRRRGVFILGFMLSGSRAGLALGMFGCLSDAAGGDSGRSPQRRQHWLFATMAVGLFFIAAGRPVFHQPAI